VASCHFKKEATPWRGSIHASGWHRRSIGTLSDRDRDCPTPVGMKSILSRMSDLLPRTRYRYGHRDDQASADHNAAQARLRREYADADFPPSSRQILLRLVSGGMRVVEASAHVNVTPSRVRWVAIHDEDFGKQLDDAEREGRNPNYTHPSVNAYRNGKCRCPECRAYWHRQDKRSKG
jgi:hypothetical protein